MIENVPTADEMLTVSLRLYFKAWSDVADILMEWRQYSPNSFPERHPDRGEYHIEPAASDGPDRAKDWREYIEAAQTDLQAILALIQQSQEIGLKARICAVSPYLLLKRTEVRASDPARNVWDFTDFPTLDASELIRVHDVFCPSAMPQAFRAAYDEIRRNRNKIAHLGLYRDSIDPSRIIDSLQLQYRALYPERNWMEDRLRFSTLGRWSDWADGDFNERTSLLNELWSLLPGLSDRQYEWLMEQPRSETRFICFACTDDARLGEGEPYPADVPTAYLGDDGGHVACIVCRLPRDIRPATCVDRSCGCGIASSEPASDGRCMLCGRDPSDRDEDDEPPAPGATAALLRLLPGNG